MKWNEPWKTSIRKQDKYNLFSKHIFLSCFKWTCIFLFFMALLSLINWEFYPNRFLYAPIVGIPLTLFIYTIQWFSPINISSGPNGIVVDKGGTLLLIPWEKIDGFEIKELEEFNKLILIIENVPDKRGLFLPKSIDIEVIKKEINENII